MRKLGCCALLAGCLLAASIMVDCGGADEIAETGSAWRAAPNAERLVEWSILRSRPSSTPTPTPTSTPTPIPTPIPTPVAIPIPTPTLIVTPAFTPTPALAPCDFDDCRKREFMAGWLDGGRSSEARAEALVHCESTWRLDPPGFFLGLAQFHPGTWRTVSGWTGLGDWRDPYHQGLNAAVWANHVANPGSTAGWPTCWWAVRY